METQDLLIEIGTEELPPKALETLSETFSALICQSLEQQQLKYGIAIPYATPRRLAVLIKNLPIVTPEQAIEKRGPALQAAFDAQGKPSKAAEGFARSCGVTVAELEKLETDKGSWLVFKSTQAGVATASLIPNIVNQALAGLPIPKRMRWGSSDYEFVRPVHWIVLLFGSAVIEASIMGIQSGRETRGHRFHHPDSISLQNASEYAHVLEEKGFVYPLLSTRKARIEILIKEAAEQVGGQAVIDPNLLTEVACLVEYPMPITGTFEQQFLEVPAEALIATMKGNQKYFHIVDNNQRLMPYFIAISNIKSSNPDSVRKGNEKVIRPRFTDAAFFWQQDKLVRLDSHLERLKTVVFQEKLGTLYQKAERVAQLAGFIATQLNAEAAQGERAGLLSKCDLMSDMVNEFPELQGIMGEYYARHDGESEAVAIALREQYLPRFWGDDLPQSAIGQAVALAEKLDTLMGIFGIGQPPTGDKDPFGLRRAAISSLRICIESELSLNLLSLLNYSVTTYPEGLLKSETALQVFEYILERLRGYAQESGLNGDSVEAVLSCRPEVPLEAIRRMQAVEEFRKLSEAESLAAANKRIQNILKKSEEKMTFEVNESFLVDEAEKALYAQLTAVKTKVTPLLQANDYSAFLGHLAALREVVDTFFDKVMVMAEDEKVRQNRLALLGTLRELFLTIADISKLQG